MVKYALEFILEGRGISNEEIRGYIEAFAEKIEIENCGSSEENNFKINLLTQDPTIIFDACAELGRIKQVKVSEI